MNIFFLCFESFFTSFFVVQATLSTFTHYSLMVGRGTRHVRNFELCNCELSYSTRQGNTALTFVCSCHGHFLVDMNEESVMTVIVKPLLWELFLSPI